MNFKTQMSFNTKYLNILEDGDKKSALVYLNISQEIFETYNEALLYNRLYIYIKSNKNLFDQLVQIIQNEDLNFIHIKGLPIPKLTPNLYTVDNQDIVRLQEHIESDIQLINDNVTTINTGALLKKTEYNELLYVFSENTKWNIAINKYAFDQNGNVMINNKNIIDYTSKLNNKQDISYIDRGLATLKKQAFFSFLFSIKSHIVTSSSFSAVSDKHLSLFAVSSVISKQIFILFLLITSFVFELKLSNKPVQPVKENRARNKIKNKIYFFTTKILVSIRIAFICK